ncbi:MAG TPA: S8 family serine peptidase [Actinomycetota bacterium]|nr:S8 family serine peptidase [Actinomycetota bacterium]
MEPPVCVFNVFRNGQAVAEWFMVEHMRVRKLVALVAAWVLVAAVPAAARTDDPLYDQLWGLRRIGAESAWQYSRGEGVVIAVIDTGVDLEHPDLKDQVVPGMSVVGEGQPDDKHGHGSLIAGIAAAGAGNAEGIAGVAPDARVLPVRVFDAAGSATSSSVARAIRFAVDAADRRRAKLVLNLSFVGPSQPQTMVDGDPGSAIFGDEAVKRAVSDAAASGAVVVTAAGNESAPHTAFDPPSHEGIIVVGASDKEDKCTTFTNYGPGLDILAPGIGILSTYWNASDDKSGYAYADGTSMAVPFVAGAAALLMAEGLTNVEAVDRLISTARGPGVSCRQEGNRYRILDVAAAFGVTREEGDVGGPDDDKEPSTPIPSALILQGDGEAPVVVDPETGAQALAPNDQVSGLLKITPLRALATSLLFVVLTFMLLARTYGEPEP